MNYRLLTPDEWEKLHGVIPDEFIPSAEASVVAVAEDDDGKILGVLPLQLQWHLEPLVILSPTVNFMRLKQVLDEQLKPFPGSCYYAFVDSPKVIKIAEHMGLTLKPTLVFRGEVT